MREHVAKAWSPGEHASVTAPTGYGKTYLVTHGLLPLWRYVLTIDIKGDDPELIRGAGRKIEGYPSRWDLYGDEETRFRISPGGLSTATSRRLDEVFRKVWASGRRRRRAGTWTLYLDEVRVLSENLGLRKQLQSLYIMGRGRGITLIGSTQAPRNVGFSEYYDQPRWHFIGSFRDARVIQRLSEIGGSGDMIREVVPDLDDIRHEFLVLGPGNYAARTFVRA